MRPMLASPPPRPGEADPRISHRTVTWTHLARDAAGSYEALDPGTAAAIDAVWRQARTGSYPAIALPADAIPPKPVAGCGKTLTLTSPVIAATNAFVRWTDGTNRRTMALHKNADGWTVVAEGPALIG